MGFCGGSGGTRVFEVAVVSGIGQQFSVPRSKGRAECEVAVGLRPGAGLEAGTGIYRALGQHYSPRALVVLLLVPILGVDAVPLPLDPTYPKSPGHNSIR